jgi:putative Mg2+ transporter-C (MgtC) family protein
MLSHEELLLRVAVGAILGGVIGYERHRHRRPVGLRTHFIVALAAASFMVVSSQFAYYQHFAPGDLVEVDASRIAAQVVAAIGFLGAGAILRTGPTVQGMTTAAGLWLVTAIGMAAGAGMFIESVGITALGLGALAVLRGVVDKDDHAVRRRVTVTLQPGSEALDQLEDALKALASDVIEVESEHTLGANGSSSATFELRLPSTVHTAAVVQGLRAVSGVARVEMRLLD